MEMCEMVFFVKMVKLEKNCNLKNGNEIGVQIP